MKQYKNHTLNEYCLQLSAREPVPGGGSASALTGALGASLLVMVAQYSLGRNNSKAIENKIKRTLVNSEEIQKRMLELVDLDAKAYLEVVRSRKLSKVKQKQALKQGSKVPLEVCRLSYKAVQLAPVLVELGNKHLISDVEAAVEMLLAAYKSGLAFIDTSL